MKKTAPHQKKLQALQAMKERGNEEDMANFSKAYDLGLPKGSDPLDVIVEPHKWKMLKIINQFLEEKAENRLSNQLKETKEHEYTRALLSGLGKYKIEHDLIHKEKVIKSVNGATIRISRLNYLFLYIADSITDKIADGTVAQEVIKEFYKLYIGEDRQNQRIEIFSYFLFYETNAKKQTNLYLFKDRNQYSPRIMTEEQFIDYKEHSILSEYISIDLGHILSRAIPLVFKDQKLLGVVLEEREQEIIHHLRNPENSKILVTRNSKGERTLHVTRPIKKEELKKITILEKEEGYGTYSITFREGRREGGEITTTILLEQDKAWENRVETPEDENWLINKEIKDLSKTKNK